MCFISPWYCSRPFSVCRCTPFCVSHFCLCWEEKGRKEKLGLGQRTNGKHLDVCARSHMLTCPEICSKTLCIWGTIYTPFGLFRFSVESEACGVLAVKESILKPNQTFLSGVIFCPSSLWKLCSCWSIQSVHVAQDRERERDKRVYVRSGINVENTRNDFLGFCAVLCSHTDILHGK